MSSNSPSPYLAWAAFFTVLLIADFSPGQDLLHSYQNAKEHIQKSEGDDRVRSYITALEVDYRMSTEDRWKVLRDATYEYGDQSENAAGRAVSNLYEGFWLSRQSKYSDANEMLQSAKPWAKKCQDDFPQIWFCLLSTQAQLHFWKGDREKCIDGSNEALDFAASRPDADLLLNRPLRMLGLVAGKLGDISEAVKYAHDEIEYGRDSNKPHVCAAGIQRLIGLLQVRNGRKQIKKIRHWLQEGEKYLEKDPRPRLKCFFALRRATLADLENDKNAIEKYKRYASILDASRDSFQEVELAQQYKVLSRHFERLRDSELAKVYRKKSEAFLTGSFFNSHEVLANVGADISKGRIGYATVRLKSVAEKVKGEPWLAEQWHRLSATVEERKGNLKEALKHQRDAEVIAKQIKELAVSKHQSSLEDLYKEKQQQRILDGKRQTELTQARGFLSLLGLAGVGILLRLRFVNRIKQETERMNEELAIELRQRTEQLELETDKRYQLELEYERKQRHEAIGQLAAGISHDFNNLLTVIANAQQNLKEIETLPPAQNELLSLAGDATDRASGIVRQLMSFARGEPSQAEQLSIQNWLRSMQGLFTSTLTGEIEFTVKSMLDDVFVLVDESQLSTAMINLFSNARDAVAGNETCKKVSLVIEKVPARIADNETAPLGHVRLTVTDNGEGIAPDLLPKVLRPYVTTKDGIGTGLGLSMVTGFVEGAGGELRIVSEQCIGTQVTMSFPSVSADSVAVMKAKPNPESITGKRILVVEDDALVRRSTVALLRSAGFIVNEVESGDAAVSWLENNPPPFLVLSDIRMPGELDGVMLRRHILEKYSEVVVVLMTGHATQDIDEGASVVAKPFSLKRLLAEFTTASNQAAAKIETW